ncbi:MAG: glycosyltransferase [Synergistaceae bacterium]|nr:glycosyltransferase [Synergistaceae bacterium]
METFSLSVIIATKDRHLALKYVSLPSLVQTRRKQFVTVVWDASENTLAQQVAEKFSSKLYLDFCKAPRVGLPSQRNDAVKYVLTTYPSVQYVLFIDDDSRLSPDAIGGVVATFEKYPDVWGVHIPLHDSNYPYDKIKVDHKGNYVLLSPAPTLKPYRFVTPYVVVGSLPPESNDTSVEWAQGCGMAFRRAVFAELKMRFNEELQHFGGYALAEDIFFSTQLRRIYSKKLWSSVHGYLRHLESPGGRVDEEKRVASELYNLRLLFDMLNEKVVLSTYLWRLLRFKIGRLARWCAQCQIYSLTVCWRGFLRARKAYGEYRKGGHLKN